nr:hypothetical protein [uncultured Carboxylicivirga sp.]
MSIKKLFYLLIISLVCNHISAKVTEIPYTQLPTGQLVIELYLDNIELPQLFIVETSGGNFIRNDINFRLNTIGIDTLKSNYTFNKVKIGGREFKKINFKSKLTLGKRSKFAFPDAIIGTVGPELFKDRIVQFDFNKQIIKIADSKTDLNLSETTPIVHFSNSFINRMPVFDIKPINHERQLVDIEVSIPLGINLAWIGEAQRLKYTNLTDMTPYRIKLDDIQTIDVFEMTIKELYFENSIVFYNIPITYCNEIRPIIGYQFLRNYITTFDFKNNLLYLQPNTLIGTNWLSENQ